MNARPLALSTSLLALVLGCSKDPPGPATTAASSARPHPTARASAAVQVARGPCATDADCTTWLEPCTCGCLGIVGQPPDVSDARWRTLCGGGPPGNCGVASPCMNRKAICDQDTKTCQAVKWR